MDKWEIEGDVHGDGKKEIDGGYRAGEEKYEGGKINIGARGKLLIEQGNFRAGE